MTAPDPSAVASVGAEAVEAAAQVLYATDAGDYPDEMTQLLADADSETRRAYQVCAQDALAAALPHLRAQWLDEIKPDVKELAEAVVEDTVTVAFRGGWDAHATAVNAALRDIDAILRWRDHVMKIERSINGATLTIAADYLRDTLTPEETT